MKVISKSEIASIFAIQNLEYLGEFNNGKHWLIKYRCLTCGYKGEKLRNRKALSTKCWICGHEDGNGLKKSLEEVKKIFFDGGCLLLAEEYISNLIKMPYICECDEKSEISLAHFQEGQRCKKCAGIEKPTYNEVESFFASNGYKLLDKKYIGNKTKMKFICPNGHKHSISYKAFKRGQRCAICFKKIKSNSLHQTSQRLSYETVKSYFASQGYDLKEAEYISSKTKMRCVCQKGHETSIDWNKFRLGRRCNECAKQKRSALFRCDIEKVRIAFQSVKLILLSDNYVNSRQSLWYLCEKCGDVSHMMYMSVLQGHSCRQCGINRTADSCRLTLDDIILRLLATNMTLLLDRIPEKINTNEYFWYCCNDCGHEGKILGNNIGRRACANCKASNIQKSKQALSNRDLSGLKNLLKERRKDLGSKTCKRS